MAGKQAIKTGVDYDTAIGELNSLIASNKKFGLMFNDLPLQGQVTIENVYATLRKDYGQTAEAAAYWAKTAMIVVDKHELNDKEVIGLIKMAWEINKISGTQKTAAGTEFFRKKPLQVKGYVKPSEAYSYLADAKNSYEDGELAHIFDTLKTALSDNGAGGYTFQIMGQDTPHSYLGHLALDVLKPHLRERGFKLYMSKG